MKNILVVFASLIVFSCTNKPQGSHGQDAESDNPNISKEQYESVIDEVLDLYRPTFIQHGANFKLKNHWDSDYAGAGADRDGDDWIIVVYGGLARSEKSTIDALYVTICHEVGHHLAGFPFSERRDFTWGASEGQADYFAAKDCLKKVWKQKHEENATYRHKVNEVAKKSCDQVNENVDEQNLCYRITVAAKEFMDLLIAEHEGDMVSYHNPSTKVAEKTITSYPSDQCRLDTFLSGALCHVQQDMTLIPGRDFADGEKSKGAERISAMNSCSEAGLHLHGKRPSCWFKPQLQIIDNLENLQKVEVSGNGDSIWDPGETFNLEVPITNELLVPITNMTLTVKEKQSGTQHFSTYPTMDLSESRINADIITIASDLEHCGEQIPLDFQFEIGDYKKVLHKNITMGGYVHAETVSSGNIEADVPLNHGTLTLPLNINHDQQVDRAAIDIDMFHYNLRSVLIVLIDPNDNRYIIEIPNDSMTKLKRKIEITLPSTIPNGEWKLTVRDPQSDSHIGKVHSWGLSFSKYSCQP